MSELTIRSMPGPANLMRIAIDELSRSIYLEPNASAVLWDNGDTSITVVRGAGNETVILLRPSLVPAVEAIGVVRTAA